MSYCLVSPRKCIRTILLICRNFFETEAYLPKLSTPTPRLWCGRKVKGIPRFSLIKSPKFSACGGLTTRGLCESSLQKHSHIRKLVRGCYDPSRTLFVQSNTGISNQQLTWRSLPFRTSSTTMSTCLSSESDPVKYVGQ